MPRHRPELPVPAVPGTGRGAARPVPLALSRVPPVSASPSGTPGRLPVPARARPQPFSSLAFLWLPARHFVAPALSFHGPISCTDPCGLPPFLLHLDPSPPPVSPFFPFQGLLSVHSCPLNAFHRLHLKIHRCLADPLPAGLTMFSSPVPAPSGWRWPL